MKTNPRLVFAALAAFALCPGAQADSTHAKVQLWAGGPYWATTNIGADEPWDYGYYFWWGDTVGYKRESDAWVASDGSNSNFSFNSANVTTRGKSVADLLGEGWITANGVLASEHDAAQAHWGGVWRMPTNQELSDLISNCNWTWTTTNSVSGYIVCGKGVYSSNRIFIPASGLGGLSSATSFSRAGSYGYIWSSAPYSDGAWSLDFGSDYKGTYKEERHYGLSIRPVCDTTDIPSESLEEGLVAHYPFDGDILDVSGNDYHWMGTAATWTANRGGEDNSAALFSGSGSLSPNANFKAVRIETNLTVAVWVKPSAMLPTGLSQSSMGLGGKNLPSSQTQILYPAHGGSSAYAGVGLFVGANGVAVVRHRNEDIPVTLLWYNDIGEDWVHVAITISDNGVPLLYVNGEHVATGVQIYNGKTNFIGGSPYSESYSSYVGPFMGALDDMRFYNRALSAGEVASFMGTWTITWVNDDDTEIDTTDVGIGFVPAHADPTKAAEAPYKWVFTGWSPELEAAVSNTTYTATFKKVADLALCTNDWTAAGGDEIVGETAHEVSIPGGAHVTINGVAVTGIGGGGSAPAPAFAEGGASEIVKFAQAEGGKWTITAFAELGNASVGEEVTSGQVKVYAADTVDGLKTASALTEGVAIENKSAVKSTIQVTAPSGKDSQFFRVKFGE